MRSLKGPDDGQQGTSEVAMDENRKMKDVEVGIEQVMEVAEKEVEKARKTGAQEDTNRQIPFDVSS